MRLTPFAAALLALFAAALLAPLSGCAPVRGDDDDDDAVNDDDAGDVVTLAVGTSIELPWNLVQWTERTSESTGEIPTPPDGLVPGTWAETEVEPGEYAIEAEEPSGCFAWLETTGPLELGDRFEWTISEQEVACMGGR